MKTKGICKLDSLSIFDGVAARKLTNAPAVIFSDLCRSRWVYFHETDYCIIYSYLQRSFKIGVLKTLYTVHKKTTVLESLFNKPATF